MDRDKILTACGWRGYVGLPLIAERIVNHCVDYIAELEAQVKRLQNRLNGAVDPRIAELEAQLDAVRPYIQHHGNCPAESTGKNCDCGLSAALKGEDDV